MNLLSFKHDDWINQWAGNWSILTISYWGIIYTRKPFSKNIKRYVNQSVIAWSDGKSKAYQRSSLKKKFSTQLADKIRKDDKVVLKICEDIKLEADKFLEFVEKYQGKDITFDQYLQFQRLIKEYYPYHIQLKMVVDRLDQRILEKHMSKLEETRLYVEPVFSESEKFMKKLASIHSKKTGYDSDLILATFAEEFHGYLLGKEKLPPRNILKKRNRATAIFFEDGKMKYFLNDEKKISDFENSIVTKDDDGVLKGNAAYPGKVTGKVKIISDPEKYKGFRRGDILVTGMTRPEYLHLMKKAAAVVTDSGGVLCHAAITARELRKTTIISTERATKILKDGDLVEVDADRGVVRKMK